MLTTSRILEMSYFQVITNCLPLVLMTLLFNYHPRWCSGDNQSVRSSVPVVNRWLWPGNRTFLEVVSMMVTWWIVAFLCSGSDVCLVSRLTTPPSVQLVKEIPPPHPFCTFVFECIIHEWLPIKVFNTCICNMFWIAEKLISSSSSLWNLALFSSVWIISCHFKYVIPLLTLNKVLVTTIDALGHFQTR